MSMAMWDKKKQLTTIMARRRGSDGGAITAETPMKPEAAMSEGGEIDGKHIAAQEMMEAFHAKSAHGLNEAMSNFIDLHLNEKPGSTEVEPESEED